MDKVAFNITCPYCKQILKCPAGLVGSERLCPGCHKRFFISAPVAVPLKEDAGDGAEESNEFAWEFSEEERSIDDIVVRHDALSASEHQCSLGPRLICRTNVKKCSVSQEVLIHCATKVFSIRDELPPARIRFDHDETIKMPVSASETGNACFFAEAHMLVTRLRAANRLLVEIQLMRHGTKTFEFDVRGFASLHCRLLAGAVGARMKQLLGLNQELVDYVFRLGPRNVEALIEVLSKDKLLASDQLDEARRKELPLFAAAQAFGEKYHVAEIFGLSEGRRINDQFPFAVYNKLSSATRLAIGKLVIGE